MNEQRFRGKEGLQDAENISAQKETARQGAWLPEADEHQERPQGFGAEKVKGQKKAVRVRWSWGLCRRGGGPGAVFRWRMC